MKTCLFQWLFGSGIGGLVPSRHWLQGLRVNFGGGLRVSGQCDPQSFWPRWGPPSFCRCFEWWLLEFQIRKPKKTSCKKPEIHSSVSADSSFDKLETHWLISGPWRLFYCAGDGEWWNPATLQLPMGGKIVTIGCDWTKRIDEVAELPSPLMVKGAWRLHTFVECTRTQLLKECNKKLNSKMWMNLPVCSLQRLRIMISLCARLLDMGATRGVGT